MLRALGIEAYPVLVDTKLRHTLDEWQPSSGAFNHAIAQVRLNDQTYWFDSTANYQRGPLALRCLPNYERGLVVHPKTTALTVIPQTSGLPNTTVTEYFQVRKANESTDLKVVTVAEGLNAEWLRAQFATTPRDDIEKERLHSYSEFYPGLKKARPLTFSDDEQRNRIELTEF